MYRVVRRAYACVLCIFLFQFHNALCMQLLYVCCKGMLVPPGGIHMYIGMNLGVGVVCCGDEIFEGCVLDISKMCFEVLL